MAEIEVFQLSDSPMTIKPGERERGWFENFPDRFPYRCLPLVIANQAGLQLAMDFSFTVVWDGTPAITGIRVASTDARAATYISGHFGYGVLTFSIPHLFRTKGDTGLLVMGPANLPKIDAVPLTGIVETAWSPYTFTMNWKMLQPNRAVIWDAGEPFCQLVPLDLALIRDLKVTQRDIAEEPELQKSYTAWAESRRKFNAERKTAPRTPGPSPWQKHYFQGKLPDGQPGVDAEAHLTKTSTEIEKKS
jgi:hypothetical protein